MTRHTLKRAAMYGGVIVCLCCLFSIPTSTTAQTETVRQPEHLYRWLPVGDQPRGNVKMDTIESRIAPPPGAQRRRIPIDSFGAWLRGLPLKPSGSNVYLFNGRLKPKQHLHEAVINIDVGKRDLQQCADAAIRLRAEYLYSQQPRPDITFHYTTGDPIPFNRWAKGERPRVREYRRGGKRRWRVDWRRGAVSGDHHTNFRRYLDNVYMYAGTASLARQLKRRLPEAVQIGDMYLQGGYPGHAVVIVDLAEHPQHGTLALLAQSYMPAQQPHILKNVFNGSLSPWFKVPTSGSMYTPEWTFKATDIHHF